MRRPGTMLATSPDLARSLHWHVLARAEAATIALDGALAATFLAYVLLVRRITGRGNRWHWRHAACFAAGLVVVFGALGSGLAQYGDANPSAHVVQHFLLMMVAPPLLVLGRPIPLLVLAARGRLKRRLVAAERAPLVRMLTGPLGWALYYLSMPVYFLTGLYGESVRDEAVHMGTHAWFFAIGCCYATSIVSLDGRARQRTFTKRLLIILAAMPSEAALGITLLLWNRPLGRAVSLSATHVAGLTFWVTSMLGSGLLIATVLAQWMHEDERRVARAERLRPQLASRSPSTMLDAAE